jgi:two-component system, sensor histidine kinase LadS
MQLLHQPRFWLQFVSLRKRCTTQLLDRVKLCIIVALSHIGLLAASLAHASNTPTASLAWPSLFADSTQLIQTEPAKLAVVPAGRYNNPAQFLSNPELEWKNFSNEGLPTSSTQDVWLRFELAASNSQNLWMMRLPKQTLESMTLFGNADQAKGSNNWTAQSVGLRYPRSQWPLRSLDPAFMLSSLPDQKRQFFIRFEHRTPIMEQLQFIAPQDFVFGANRVGVLNGLMIGLFGALFLISLMSWWVNKSKSFAWFSVFVATMLFTQLTLTGYLSARVWTGATEWQRLSLWVMPLLTLAACAQFTTVISHARDLSRPVYMALSVITYGSLVLAIAVTLIGIQFKVDWLNAYYAAAMVIVIAALSWLAWRFHTWLWIVVAAILPISASVLARLAYNLGWVSHAEIGQLLGAIAACVGLLVIYASMVIHARNQMARTLRNEAIDKEDGATGLLSERIAMARLPQVLLRAHRFAQPCAVIMLRWLDFSQINAPDISSSTRSKVFAHFGSRISRVARDIDSCARIGDDLFLYIVEAPASEELINEITSRLLTSAMRPSAHMPGESGFNLHMAVWQSSQSAADAAQVLEMLKTRLSQMAQGTQRRVQFVDHALSTSPAQIDAVQARPSADELVAKINSLEKTQGLPTIALTPRKPMKATLDSGSS